MTTTIKVTDELRDRLKEQAAHGGLTLGAHLARLADAEDRRRRMLAVRDAMAATSPAEMADYLEETAAWERAELEDARG